MVGILEHSVRQVLEAPQRSAPVPDGSGRYAIYQEANHSLADHKTIATTVLLDTQTGLKSEFPSDGESSNFMWIEPSTDIVWQRQTENKTELWTCAATDLAFRHCIGAVSSNAVLFQVTQLPDGDLGALFYTSELVDENKKWPHSTGRTFTGFPYLSFDQGVGRPQYALLFLRVSTAPNNEQPRPRYSLKQTELTDVLAGSDLEFFPYSGSMPNISTPNCAISSSGIAFVAQKDTSKQLCKLSAETYFVPLPSAGSAFSRPVRLPTGDCTGWSALPVFSRDGRKIAFVRDDKGEVVLVARHIIVVQDVQDPATSKVVHLLDNNGTRAPYYPDSVLWSADGKTVYFMACDSGRYRMFAIDVTAESPIPTRVAPPDGRDDVSVMGAFIRGNGSEPGNCLYAETSFTSPNRLFTLELASGILKEVPDQKIPDFGLSTSQVSETWYESDGRQIHTFIMRPSNFDSHKKYPLALVIHGGPIAAWLHAFHLYWTLAVFAEQGYVLVLPNFTGSTGYSQEFREAAYGDFGDKPYRDLEACMDFVAKEVPYIDINRAVSLGGSYGGYMNMWLAGQPLAKRFKALILHATGGFGNTSFYTSDIPELYTRIMTRAGEEYNPVDIERNIGRWDPTPHAKNWTTPMLFSHGEKDNRCPTSNSLAAFAHCQIKGVESKLVIFPDESHFILKPENSYHWHREFFDWMDRFTES